MRNFAARAWAYARYASFAAAIVVIQAALGVSSAHAQNRNDTARVVWPFETSSLDPAGAGVQRSTWGVSWHIYDRLVGYEMASDASVQLYQFSKPKGEL